MSTSESNNTKPGQQDDEKLWDLYKAVLLDDIRSAESLLKAGVDPRKVYDNNTNADKLLPLHLVKT